VSGLAGPTPKTGRILAGVHESPVKFHKLPIPKIRQSLNFANAGSSLRRAGISVTKFFQNWNPLEIKHVTSLVTKHNYVQAHENSVKYHASS
jgi:hypothetical protein